MRFGALRRFFDAVLPTYLPDIGVFLSNVSPAAIKTPSSAIECHLSSSRRVFLTTDTALVLALAATERECFKKPSQRSLRSETVDTLSETCRMKAKGIRRLRLVTRFLPAPGFAARRRHSGPRHRHQRSNPASDSTDHCNIP